MPQRVLIFLENGFDLVHCSNPDTEEKADLIIAKVRKEGTNLMVGPNLVKTIPPYEIGYVGAHRVCFG